MICSQETVVRFVRQVRQGLLLNRLMKSLKMNLKAGLVNLEGQEMLVHQDNQELQGRQDPQDHNLTCSHF